MVVMECLFGSKTREAGPYEFKVGFQLAAEHDHFTSFHCCFKRTRVIGWIDSIKGSSCLIEFINLGIVGPYFRPLCPSRGNYREVVLQTIENGVLNLHVERIK